MDEIAETEIMVQAAYDEILMAVMFHECWKVATFSPDLHSRIDMSRTAYTFQIIRTSLRREMLLGLMRIWDKDNRSIRMNKIVDNLKNASFFDELSKKRLMSGFGDFSGVVKEVMHRGALIRFVELRDKIIAIRKKYQDGGSGYEVFKKIRTIRNHHLAHREYKITEIASVSAEDQGIEDFYSDTLEIVKHLVALVLATACDLDGTVDLCRNHATLFWDQMAVSPSAN